MVPQSVCCLWSVPLRLPIQLASLDLSFILRFLSSSSSSLLLFILPIVFNFCRTALVCYVTWYIWHASHFDPIQSKCECEHFNALQYTVQLGCGSWMCAESLRSLANHIEKEQNDVMQQCRYEQWFVLWSLVLFFMYRRNRFCKQLIFIVWCVSVSMAWCNVHRLCPSRQIEAQQ